MDLIQHIRLLFMLLQGKSKEADRYLQGLNLHLPIDHIFLPEDVPLVHRAQQAH